MRWFFILVLVLHLTACGIAPRQSGGDILVIGDSVLAWNRTSGQDVGHVIGAALGRDVVSRAALGARLRSGGLGALGGLSIPDQLSAGPWNWVVMNGGANDLGFACGCTQCDDEIDQLIAPAAQNGAIPDLIARARATGARVLWVGYYEAPTSRSFQGCRPGLVELERRIAIYAGAKEGVYFIDAEDVLDPAVPALLASDRTHPSAAGSALIGRFIAREIATRSGG
ncbi:MAG: SGNH/GDSL hydrolase family protein [Loktanella sp.]|nr:SGNH/GDSL hydrolase family protein [Loktanella sp.]